jgi:hypothetical protein
MPDQCDFPQPRRAAHQIESALYHGTQAIGPYYEPRLDTARSGSGARCDACDPAVRREHVVNPQAEPHANTGAPRLIQDGRIEIATTNRPSFRRTAIRLDSKARPKRAAVRRLDLPAS